MSPNPEVISRSREPDVDRSNWKIVVLGVLVVAFSFATFYFFDKLLLTLDALHLIATVISSLLFLVFAITTSFFVKNEWKLYLISFLSAAAGATALYDRWFLSGGVFAGIGALIFFLFMNVGFRGAASAIRNSLEMRFFLITRSITPSLVFGVIIFFSVIFFGNYFMWGRFNEALGERMFHQATTSSLPVLKLWFPDARFNQPVQGFLESVARTQLKKTNLKLGINPNDDTGIGFSKLAPEVQSALLNQTVNNMLAYIESKTGPINKKQSVEDALYGFLKNFIAKLSPQVLMAVGGILALLFLSFAKGVFGLFYWLINGLAFILFKLLIVLGFAFMSLEIKNREFVLLK